MIPVRNIHFSIYSYNSNWTSLGVWAKSVLVRALDEAQNIIKEKITEKEDIKKILFNLATIFKVFI